MNKKLVEIRRRVGRTKIRKLLVWPIEPRRNRSAYPKSAILLWIIVIGGAAGGPGGGGPGGGGPGGPGGGGPKLLDVSGGKEDAFITILSFLHWHCS